MYRERSRGSRYLVVSVKGQAIGIPKPGSRAPPDAPSSRESQAGVLKDRCTPDEDSMKITPLLKQAVLGTP